MELSRLARTALRRAVLHGDALAGVDDFDGQTRRSVVLGQFLRRMSSLPTRMTCTGKALAARMAPSTSALGA